MPGPRDTIVLELESGRLGLAWVATGGARPHLKGYALLPLPADVRPDDAERVGGWLKEQLGTLNWPRGASAIIAASRTDAVLRPLPIPAAEGASLVDPDVVGAVNLAMMRQLAFSADDAAIDFAYERRAPHGDGAALWVLAGAMPGSRVDWCRRVVRAAGMKMGRIGLRAFGVAAILAEMSHKRGGAVLGVAAGANSTEFVVVEDGRLTFSRAADTPRPDDASGESAFAERLAVEAKRTWMGYRSIHEGPDIETVAVVGEPTLADAVGRACGDALRCGWVSAGSEGLAEVDGSVSQEDRARSSALLGMVIEARQGGTMMDFARPRRAKANDGALRQRLLAGVLGLIVLGGGAYVVADQQLGKLRAELVAARANEDRVRKEYEGFIVQHARVSHFEQWEAGRVDWMGYINHVVDQMPDATLGQLDELRGKGSLGVSFSPSGAYPGGSWRPASRITLDVNGRVTSREISSDMRTRLLGTRLYEVESRGPDVPTEFAFQLTANGLTPAVETQPSRPATGGEGRRP
ncbi:MAG: hypothetical protein KF864_10880 [Phycisphaeraceae bacterium]|nr:hypothetical protein [Phycisphaeraceae bacterium]